MTSELEKLEKAIEGVQAKIQIQKANNQKLESQLNELSMNREQGLKEVSRLKDINISLQNNIETRKQQISEEQGKQELDSLLSELGKEIR